MKLAALYLSAMLLTPALASAQASSQDDAWVQNGLLGSVYSEDFPWIANDTGWFYSFGSDATEWESTWAYSYDMGWFWASDFGTDSIWVYTEEPGEPGYLSQDQFIAALRDQPVHVSDAASYPANVAGAFFNVHSASVEDGKLSISLSYVGGCKEHSFILALVQGVKEQIPPEVDVFLVHNDRNDTCEEIENKTVVFDISAELAQWADSYDEINLRIHAGKDGAETELLIDFPAPASFTE